MAIACGPFIYASTVPGEWSLVVVMTVNCVKCTNPAPSSKLCIAIRDGDAVRSHLWMYLKAPIVSRTSSRCLCESNSRHKKTRSMVWRFSSFCENNPRTIVRVFAIGLYRGPYCSAYERSARLHNIQQVTCKTPSISAGCTMYHFGLGDGRRRSWERKALL